MPDDIRQPGGDRRISLAHDYEVRYWTLALDVSKERLMTLVGVHGNSACRIRELLLAGDIRTAGEQEPAAPVGASEPRLASPLEPSDTRA